MALNFPPSTLLPYTDPVTGLKYIYNNSIGAWESAIQPPVIISNLAPSIDIPGFLYWNAANQELYIFYDDGVTPQWVPAQNSTNIIESPTEPVGADPGSLWFNTINSRLYYLYDDGVFPAWIDVSGSGSSSSNFVGPFPPTIPTPVDGDFWFDSEEEKQYVYYDGSWVDINITTGTLVSPLVSIDGSIDINVVLGNTDLRVDIDALPLLL